MNDTNQTSRTRSLSVKTSVKAGPYTCPQCRGDYANHNETQVARTRSLTVKTRIKAGPGGLASNCPPHECGRNHNQTQVARTRGLKVKAGVKAGPAGHYTNMVWASTR